MLLYSYFVILFISVIQRLNKLSLREELSLLHLSFELFKVQQRKNYNEITMTINRPSSAIRHQHSDVSLSITAAWTRPNGRPSLPPQRKPGWPSVSTCSSFRLSVAEEAVARVKRKKYGEKYDAVHPGGFTNMNFSEISDNLWNFMLGPLRVKPFMDVGCGKGTIWT